MLDDRARSDAERGSLGCPPPDLRSLDDAEGVKDGEKGLRDERGDAAAAAKQTDSL